MVVLRDPGMASDLPLDEQLLDDVWAMNLPELVVRLSSIESWAVVG